MCERTKIGVTLQFKRRERERESEREREREGEDELACQDETNSN